MTISDQYEDGCAGGRRTNAGRLGMGPGMRKGPPAVMAGGPWVQGCG